jgi:hypothetical protein
VCFDFPACKLKRAGDIGGVRVFSRLFCGQLLLRCVCASDLIQAVQADGARHCADPALLRRGENAIPFLEVHGHDSAAKGGPVPVWI